jgi:hypothetical protein
MINVGRLQYPCVDLLCRDIWPMFRAVIVRSFWVVLCGTSLALAQDPPPLEGPASEPEPSKASAPPTRPSTPPPSTAPVSPPVAAPSSVRPMLVIPGVTVPAARTGATTNPKVLQPSRPSTSGLPAPSGTGPPVAAPSNLGSAFRHTAGMPAPGAPEASLRDPIPLTLEPLDDEPAPGQTHADSTSPRRTPTRAPVSVPVEESVRAPAGPRPTPWRMPGLLGRVLGQSPANTARGSSRSDEPASRSAGKAKTKSEPATDATVKRSIEQQIRSTLGDRVQGVEVRVSGRNVLIVARATRFWQKRGVRSALESLPALAGFRARVDLER